MRSKVDARAGWSSRSIRALAAFSAVALLAVACGGNEDAAPAPSSPSAPAAPAQPTGPKEMTAAMTTDVLTLDASKDTSPISLNVFKMIYSQLTEIDRNGDVVPALAERWETDDTITWTFFLRKDMTYSDGTPVTAQDVVWTYEKVAADTESSVRTYVTSVESIEAVDDYTVRIVNNRPFATFDRQASLVSIMNQGIYEALGEEQFSLTPVGSGPFTVAEWIRDERLVLEAVENHPMGQPAIDRIIFRPVPSESARVNGLITGELDVVALLPPPEVPRLQNQDGVRVELVASNRNLYLGLNSEVAPLDNLQLRRAVDAAIDREAITSALLGGLGVPAGQPVSSVVFGYDPSIQPTPYDPELARRLVAESGYDGTPVLFQYPTDRYAFGVQVAEAVQSYLEAVGINVEMQGMEYSAYFPLWIGRELSAIHMFAFGPSIMDADLPLRSLYESNNRGYWSNAENDELIFAQRGEPDPVRRQALISEFFRRSQEFVPYVWLYTEVQAYGLRDGVLWEPRPDERLIFTDADLQR